MKSKLALGAAVVSCLGVAGTSAVEASAASGGSVRAFVSQVSATKARILLTGAIGDYGTTVSYNKKGKVDSNGAIQKVKLTKGGFSIDATALDQKLNKIKPSFNSSNCSALFSGTGTGKLFGGSGAYKVIRGTLKITVTFAEVAPRYTSGAKQGQCNFADSARPMAQFNAITATGNVTY